MDAEIFREMFPMEYMNRFISNHLRVDGRQFAQPRQISIEFTEGITNYQYADCFISAKHILKETEAKEIDLSQCIRFQITFDNQDDLNNQEKARIERFYINHIQDIVQQILDPQNLRKNNNKVENIEFTIRVAGSDGSLLSHLINCVYFALTQIKHEKPIISREIKVQTFAVVDDKILIDPSQFEEQNTSTVTIVSFLDDGQFQLKKTDGKALNYLQIHQIMSQF